MTAAHTRHAAPPPHDPAHPAPERLVALVSGEADPPTTAHVATCSVCAAALASYAALDRALRAHLCRADCPASLVLGDLALDLLGADDARAVRRHLALCPHCSADLATLRLALREDSSGDTFGDTRGDTASTLPGNMGAARGSRPAKR